jgi:hypothetical protein
MNIKSVRKTILYAFGIAAIGAVSASAFAQSTEYRRGYDQGYRDGAEAQSQQGQPARAARIVVDQAIYGTRGAQCDAREKVQQAIGWRRNVAITANNELCGDPAPGRQKRLDIKYRCGDGPALAAQTREGSSVTLNCR